MSCGPYGGRGRDLQKAAGFHQDADGLAHFEEVVVVGGLAEVDRIELLRQGAVGGEVGRGDDQDRDAAEAGGGAEVAQDFEAVTAGKVQVEDDEVGDGRVRVVLGAPEEVEGFFAIGAAVNADREALRLDGFADEEGVGEVVLSQQEIPRGRRGGAGSG